MEIQNTDFLKSFKEHKMTIWNPTSRRLPNRYFTIVTTSFKVSNNNGHNWLCYRIS